MGAKMAKQLRAVCYLENSALTQSGLKVSLNCLDGICINQLLQNSFDEAYRTVLNPDRKHLQKSKRGTFHSSRTSYFDLST